MSEDLQICVDLLQQMIRTPSLPGQEGEMAKLVADTRCATWATTK